MLVVFLVCYIAFLGKLLFIVEVFFVILIVEEMVEMEKRNKLRFKIKEEYFVVF